MTSDRLLKVTEVADELICTSNLRGYFTDVNPAFERLLGWTEDQLKAHPYTDFIHPDDRPAMESALKRLQRSGSVIEVRHRFLISSKDFVWIDWRLYLFEREIHAVGRVRPADGTDIAALITQAVRDQVAEEEQNRAQLAADHDGEVSKSTKALLASERRAGIQHTRARTMQAWIAAVAALATTIAGGAVWMVNRIETNVLRSHEAAERASRVDSKISEITTRVETSEERIRRLGEVAVETQIQVSDSTQYIADKIDAAFPKAADKVPPPDTVLRAKHKVDEIKRQHEINELFNADDDHLSLIQADTGSSP